MDKINYGQNQPSTKSTMDKINHGQNQQLTKSAIDKINYWQNQSTTKSTIDKISHWQNCPLLGEMDHQQKQKSLKVNIKLTKHTISSKIFLPKVIYQLNCVVGITEAKTSFDFHAKFSWNWDVALKVRSMLCKWS